MKKFLSIIALVIVGMANAQTWTQNFNATTPPALPAGWLQINGDGNTTLGMSSYSFGTNAGVSYNVWNWVPTYGNALLTTSSYSPSGTSNDWVITPSFSVPANSAFSWEAASYLNGWLEAYEIRVSTTGTTQADFLANPPLYSTPGETWYQPYQKLFHQRSVLLSAYTGQTVRLAIHDISNNKYMAGYDNFSVAVVQSVDGNITSIDGLKRYQAGAGNHTITGTFREMGFSNANTAVLNYKLNSNAVVTETITFASSLPYFSSSSFTFSTLAPFALGTNNLKVWVSAVNGIPEVVNANDTAKTVVYVASAPQLMNVLIEEFTSESCGPCVSLNSTFDPLVNSNFPNTGGRVNVVKDQAYWPLVDPSNNAHSTSRINYYQIGGIPETQIGGNLYMTNHTQAEIDTAKNVPAYATISAYLTVNGNSISGSATVTPFVTISSLSPLKVYQALIQEHYYFPGAYYSQKDFYHVMRKMFPDGNGSSINTTDGVPQVVSFNHNAVLTPTPVAGSFDTWVATNLKYEYVVWVQDVISHEIIQSGSATQVVTTGIVKLEENSSIGIYPNPAKDHAVVAIKLSKPTVADVFIYDLMGKLVYTNKGANVEEGQNEMTINTSEFAAGTFNVIVITSEGVLKDKLIIVK